MTDNLKRELTPKLTTTSWVQFTLRLIMDGVYTRSDHCLGAGQFTPRADYCPTRSAHPWADDCSIRSTYTLTDHCLKGPAHTRVDYCPTDQLTKA